MFCRNCKKKLNKPFLNLGSSPPSNSFYNPKLYTKEYSYPLLVYVCNNCWLMQVEQFTKKEELFDRNYPYLSGTSLTWVNHCKLYAKMIIDKLALDNESLVIELASNDGTLLNFFKKKKIKCLGIEPTNSTAKISKNKKIDTLIKFFDFELAKKLSSKNIKADLLIANNVFAHVPNLNSFTKGVKKILKKNGIVTIEFPHLLNLIKFNQYDTIYHEHFSYFSLISAVNILKKHKLKVFDLHILETHGGSLRLFVTHLDNKNYKIKSIVNRIITKEIKYGLNKYNTYKLFQKNVYETNKKIYAFFNKIKNENKKIIGFAAAAKGNTLLNFAKITNKEILYVCDNSKFKQNKLLPGSHIPVFSPKLIKKTQPDYIIVLAWNIYDEIVAEIKKIYKKKIKFVRFIPKLKIEIK